MGHSLPDPTHCVMCRELSAMRLKFEVNSTRQQKNISYLEQMLPRQSKILDSLANYNCDAYQFDEAKAILQLQSISNFTAAVESEIFPEHLLQAITCSIPDQSMRAMASLTNLVNLVSRGQLPSWIAQVFVKLH